MLKPNSSIEVIFEEIRAELARAQKWGPMCSLHDAYGVIAEEFAEFEEIVFQKQPERSNPDTRAELMQLATMAIKAILCEHIMVGKE
jgi:hypothetical protein